MLRIKETLHQYRPEIDGLRAVAVTLVIIYHAGLGNPEFFLLPGGLIGVDIFFVISGYLITSIIQSDFDSFSIGKYYERRIRRIMPALLLTIILSIPFACILLAARSFDQFSGSAQSAVVFISNLYFWKLDSYTAAVSQLQPLLHTWSLGVEEQFYIFYPIALLTIKRFLKNYITCFIALAFSLSFLLTVTWGNYHPNANFYLLPSRSWELLAGALLARAELFYGRLNLGKNQSDFFVGFGLALILGPAMFLENQLVNPGWYSLLPIAGACLVIWCSNPLGRITKTISSRPIVQVGLISYSLYLFHQPILVFSRIASTGLVSTYGLISQIVLTFILSWLSWRYIETPFRNRSLWKFRSVFYLLICFGVVVIVSTWVVSVFKGNQDMQPINNMLLGGYQETALTLDGSPCHGRWTKNACRFGNSDAKEVWYVVGDSHASTLSPSLLDALKLMKKDIRFINLTQAGCLYAPSLYREYGDANHCHDFSEEWRKELLSSKPANVIISGRLPLYLHGNGFNNEEGGIEYRTNNFLTADPSGNIRTDPSRLQNTLVQNFQELVDHGHRLVFVYPTPEVGWNVPEKYGKLAEGSNKDLISKGITTSYSVFQSRTASAYAVYDAVSGGNVVRIYPAKEFCNSLLGRCITYSKNEIYYRDDNHLSLYGAKIIVKKIIDEVDKNEQTQPFEKRN